MCVVLSRWTQVTSVPVWIVRFSSLKLLISEVIFTGSGAGGGSSVGGVVGVGSVVGVAVGSAAGGSSRLSTTVTVACIERWILQK